MSEDEVLAIAAGLSSSHPGAFLCLREDGEAVIMPTAAFAALEAVQGGVCQVLRIPD